MRITKAILQQQLDGAIAHQKCKIIQTDEPYYLLRNDPKFIPVEKYSYGQIPLLYEMGKINGYRYVSRLP